MVTFGKSRTVKLMKLVVKATGEEIRGNGKFKYQIGTAGPYTLPVDLETTERPETFDKKRARVETFLGVECIWVDGGETQVSDVFI